MTLYDAIVHRTNGDTRPVAATKTLKAAKAALDEYLLQDPEVRHAEVKKRSFTLGRVAGAPTVYGNEEGAVVYRLRVKWE